MNWDTIKADLDATVRQQSVKVLDEAIAHLQEMRAKLLAGEMDMPPPISPPPAPEAGGPVQPAPVKTSPPPPVARITTKPDPPPRNCEECGTEFKPNHGRTRLCSDKCREARKQAAIARNLAKLRKERQAKVDAADKEAREIEAQQRAAAPPPPQPYRREPSSMPQAAPRIKLKRVKLPAMGGYAPVGSPEAAAAIERVKAGARKEAAEAKTTIIR